METKDMNLSNIEKAKNLMLACVKENGYTLEPLWKEQGEHFKKFEVRPDDIWIMTLPRSGTTITQEIVFLLMNDFDFETAKKYPFFVKVQSFTTSLCQDLWLNCNMLIPSKDSSKKFDTSPVDATKSSAEAYVNLPSPRVFKTHLTFSIIPQILKSGAKTIYVARNPKDRLVSWYKLIPQMIDVPYVIDFTTFWQLAQDEKVLYEPTWKHIKEGWAERNNPNVLFLFYEEIQADLRGVIQKIADFLGKSITDEQMEQTLHHLDIDNFRNSHINVIKRDPVMRGRLQAFVNKGKVGGYKDLVTPEVNKEMDEWIQENLRDTDIIFPESSWNLHNWPREKRWTFPPHGLRLNARNKTKNNAHPPTPNSHQHRHEKI